MKQAMIFMGAAAVLAIVHQPETGTAAEPAFRVVVDDAYRRPVIRRTPPKDRNDEQPLDVIQKFLKATNDGDFAAAAKFCRFGFDDDPPFRDRPSIEGKDFAIFCEKVRANVKEVTLSGSAIASSSSSIVYSKGHSWSVWYRRTPSTDETKEGFFLMLQVDGVWKIREKPHWHSVVTGERSVTLGGVPTPQW